MEFFIVLPFKREKIPDRYPAKKSEPKNGVWAGVRPPTPHFSGIFLEYDLGRAVTKRSHR
jgi:hypothetical protein